MVRYIDSVSLFAPLLFFFMQVLESVEAAYKYNEEKEIVIEQHALEKDIKLCKGIETGRSKNVEAYKMAIYERFLFFRLLPHSLRLLSNLRMSRMVQ